MPLSASVPVWRPKCPAWFFTLLMLKVFAACADTGVAIDAGTVTGIQSNGITAYKGIPFAAAPIGGLRWKPPVAQLAWPTTLRADAYGPDCMQKPVPGDAAASGSRLDEDCLYLNVWRPSDTSGKLPVLVWVYGGGFVNGGASPAIYDGSALARHGLIVVSFNYRLGRLGFFAHPALTEESRQPVANFGLMDQIFALHWIQRNIAAFGGDTARVTVMGESAGGISVLQLMNSPEAKKLFQRAIIMSGGGRSFVIGGQVITGNKAEIPNAERAGLAFARSKGIRGTDASALAKLRALPATAVTGDLGMVALLRQTPTYAGGPVIDGQLILGTPQQSLDAARTAPIPLMIGSTGQDIGTTLPLMARDALNAFGANRTTASRLYDPEGKLNRIALNLAINADATMHEPARFVAQHLSLRGAPVWLYRFNYVAESRRAVEKGAGHASELPFAFGTLDVRYGKAATARDRLIADGFSRYIANFAKHANPNGEGLTDWPQMTSTGTSLMLFTQNGPMHGPDPLRARLDLVQSAFFPGLSAK